jgi:FtsP/CotA-like multicopper oxidase with cupredoxin domain
MTTFKNTKLTRRGLMAGALAGAALPALPAFGQSSATDPMQLRAQVAMKRLLPEQYGMTEIWGYGGGTPAQEIRVAQGARVQRRLINELPQPTSIHWHGIRIDNAMDGVSGLTQDAVETGGVFDYDFVAPDAGTYWYHAHNRSTEQVARGLYGPLIVEEADALDIDREEVLMFDDWLVDPSTGQLDSDFDAAHDQSHAGRNGNYIVTNGTFGLTMQTKQNERMRLRLINTANARIFELQFTGLSGWVVALDGMPLAAPHPLEEFLILAPAQRADVIVDVTAEQGEVAGIVAMINQQPQPQVVFEVTGVASQNRRADPSALPPNDHTMVSLDQARQIDLRMEGGAMGGLRSATLAGENKGFRELANAGHFWAFNGAIGLLEDPPLAKLEQGEHVRLSIENDTSFPHAMHLHGMHFHEVAADGTLGPLRDTTLVFGGKSQEIAFVADNPGNWLFHCHMLSHAASGMMARIEVA